MGLVAGSLVFGTAIAVVGERAKLVLDFVVAFSEIIMVLLNYYLKKLTFEILLVHFIGCGNFCHLLCACGSVLNSC